MKIYYQSGSDAAFAWDYNETDNLLTTSWMVYNKTVKNFVTLRMEDENGNVMKDPARPPAAYVGRLKREGRATLIIKNITDEDSVGFKCILTEKVTFLETESTVELIVTGN